MLKTPAVAFLIDPNDSNTDPLIQIINEIKPGNVWVGCSTSSGNIIRSVFDRLKIGAKLFPGTIDQIVCGDGVAEQILLPVPLHPVNKITDGLQRELARIIPNLQSSVHRMSYVLLNTNCTAARVLGLTSIPDYREIIDNLEKENPASIYIEGGSRSNGGIKEDILSFMETLRKIFPESRITYGGGIRNTNDINHLSGIADEVIVSHAIHEDPNVLHNFI